MILYPALDLKDGQLVRYLRGFDDGLQVDSRLPMEAAKEYAAQGFHWLHVVDLNGAVSGKPENQAVVEAIVQASSVPVQLGGGLRNLAEIEFWLARGVSRVVVGTMAQKNPQLVKEACRLFPNKIAVSIDAVGGKVALSSWSEQTSMSAIDLALRYEDAGAAAIIYTDIARVGTVSGVNVAAMADLAFALTTPVIAAGGLADIADIEALREQETSGIVGLICGRALYDGRVNPVAALEAAGTQEDFL